MLAILEGLLFVIGDEGLTLKDIVNILEINEDDAKKLLKELHNEYLNDKRGIQLEYFGERFKLTTKRKHAKYYEKLVTNEQNNKLSDAALEVLSIIAYSGPITRVNIDKIRGVSSAYIVRKLVLKNLIEECGKSEDVGRPMLYKITDQFLNYFGLSSIKDLPEIKEIEANNDNNNLFETKYHEENSK